MPVSHEHQPGLKSGKSDRFPLTARGGGDAISSVTVAMCLETGHPSTYTPQFREHPSVATPPSSSLIHVSHSIGHARCARGVRTR